MNKVEGDTVTVWVLDGLCISDAEKEWLEKNGAGVRAGVIDIPAELSQSFFWAILTVVDLEREHDKYKIERGNE